ncbi:uncharacterized protein LOC129956435 [Argiope bruennichi]|uniref:Uncharacterized protein n=1 Tax=Argiope bruennichi TaxID=94029 RepID=A0A8T0FCX5_ARGBR|nr:uncharacterized protein LOC129956435 [Argiope bruennichi]KAF8789134.1 hypothetical protein HNY73_007103 [Argiope bruennichi]
MSKRKLLFKKIFCSNECDSEPFLDDGDVSLASFVYNVACEEIREDNDYSDDEPDMDGKDEDTYSILSFDEKVDAAVENFERVVALFKKTKKAKDSFLKSFEQWAPTCKNNIQLLKESAEAIQTDKFNSDIAKVVGGVVAAVGGIVFGISFITPLAVVTVPLAIGGGIASAVGGTVVAGTTGTEIALLKKKLEGARALVQQEMERFFAMTHWFSFPEEVKKALESLLSYNLLKEMAADLKKFFDEVTREANLTVGDFKLRFKEVLKLCMKKMITSSKITYEFGDDVAPVVMTFVFVFCLMKGQNRIVLDCVMITQRLAVGLLSVFDLGVQAGQLIGRLALKGAASAGEALAKFAIMEALVGLGVLIDVVNVVLSSIDLHKRPETEATKKIKEAADKLEKVFSFIESVYNEVKKYKTLARTDVNDWTAVVVSHIPDDAEKEDIKTAVKPHLPEEAWSCIKLKKLPTNGNNWLVKVPTNHSQLLLEQSHLIINEKSCAVTQ